MKPRVTAFSLAVIASLGLMNGCKKNNKITKNSNNKTEQTEIQDHDLHISFFSENEVTDLKQGEDLILEPYTHIVSFVVQKTDTIKLENGWTNSNIVIPEVEGYGYNKIYAGGDALNWSVRNTDTVGISYDAKYDTVYSDYSKDDFGQDVYLTTISSEGRPGYIYEKSIYDAAVLVSDGTFYAPHSHLVYFVYDYDKALNGYPFPAPEGYEFIGAYQDLANKKMAVFLTNFAPVLVREDKKSPGVMIKPEKYDINNKDFSLTLHP